MQKLHLFFCFLIPLYCTAQDFSALPLPLTPPDELERDLELLWQGIDQFHSGAYWYTPRDSIFSAYQQVQQQLTDSMTVLDFHRLIAPLIALTREDHADIYLPEVVRKLVLETATMLPLAVVFLNRKMYCTLDGSTSDNNLRGLEIVSINGKTPIQLVTQVGQLFSSDGFIKRVKYSDLSGLSFSYYHYLEFGDTPTFEIAYRNADSIIDTVIIAAQTLDSTREKIRARYHDHTSEEEDVPPMELAFLNDSTAYLAVHTFNSATLRKAKGLPVYRKFLANSFKAIADKGIKRLIIDVSQNGGGNEGNENLLYSYLGDNYQKYSKVRVKAERIVFDNGIDPPKRNRVFPFWERWFINQRMPDGSYERKPNVGHGLMAYKHEPDHKYTGELYVLISPVTYSGGSEFANMIFTTGRGTFVGEETGGGFYGNTSGYSYTLKLPHSGIRVRLPALQFVMNVEGLPFGSGVIPHQQLIPDIATYLQGPKTVRQYLLDYCIRN